ncbi:MAG: M15 family metallopeptidase [Oceanospirillaceae bacterium]|nr:M15 family metallopeptidase [Oceanospirillaceae bacterium]
MKKIFTHIGSLLLASGLTTGLYVSPAYSDATVPSKATTAPLSDAECAKLAEAGVFTAGNPVRCQRLSRVRFSYLSDDGVIRHDGQLVVLDAIAPNVESLMDELLERRFYIAKAQPVEAYAGDDQASMADNNTSAFNGRAVTGGSKWSLHAYGAAIDLNPVQNPFIDIAEDGTAQISPARSARYSVNRSEQRPGKSSRGGMAENVVDLFARHGFFVWGGDWNYPIDYQHFQIGPRSFVEALASSNADEGRRLIEQYTSLYSQCRSALTGGEAPGVSRKVCVGKVFDAMP